MSSVKSQISSTRLLPVFALINIAFLICYICFSFKNQFHADAAVANTLAQEIHDTGSFFPHQWHYANGDIWVLFLHLFELPLLRIMPNGYALHATACLAGAAIILCSIWLFSHAAGMTKRAHWACLAVIASGLSPNMAENLFGQQAYGFIFWICTLGMVAAWHFVQRSGRARFGWGTLALVLVLLAAWGNAQRAAVYLVLPVVAGLVAGKIIADSPTQSSMVTMSWSRIVFLSVIALALNLVGAVLHAQIIARSDSFDQVIIPAWLTFDGMIHNSLAALRGMLSLLGGLPDPGKPVVSALGVLDAVRFMAAISLLSLMPWALKRGLFSGRAGRVYLSAATSLSLMISLTIYITTTVPNATDPEASIRYVVPGLVGALLLLIQATVDASGSPVRRVIGMIALVILSLCGPWTFGLTKLGGYTAEARDATNNLVATVKFLRSQGAQYGYASYWNASTTSVLSNHAVKVRHILIADGLPQPHRFLSSDRWYEATSWQGPTFLFLTKDETQRIDWLAMSRLSGEPRRRIAFNDMTYVEYDHNIAKDLPLWSPHFTTPGRFPATIKTPHSIGEFDTTSGAMLGQAGVAGVLRYGPYIDLPTGHYQLTFNVSAKADRAANFGKVDVTADSGQRTMSSANIEKVGPQQIILSFTTTEKLRNVEFRIISSGAGELGWSSIEVQGHPLSEMTKGNSNAQ